MYRRRKYKKTSIYNPSLPTNFLPTYNQRKGMVIQKDMTPSSPRKVISHKDIDEAYKLVEKANRIPSTKALTGTVTFTFDPGESSSVILNNDSILGVISSTFHVPVSAFNYVIVDSFIVRTSDQVGTVPVVNYTWTIGDTSISDNSALASVNTGITEVFAFPSPQVYEGTNAVRIWMPHFYRNTSTSYKRGYIEYQHYGNQSSSSQYHSIYDFYVNGKLSFFWYEYTKDESLVSSTEITIDNSAETNDTVILICNFTSSYTK